MFAKVHDPATAANRYWQGKGEGGGGEMLHVDLAAAPLLQSEYSIVIVGGGPHSLAALSALNEPLSSYPVVLAQYVPTHPTTALSPMKNVC
jgi:hypothetical protein